MPHKPLLIITLCLTILLNACVPKSDYEALQAEKFSLQETLDDQEIAMSTLVDETDAQLMGQLAEIAALEIELDATTLAQSETQTSLEELQSEYDDLSETYKTAKSKITNLTATLGKHVCSKQITNMKYDNVMNASTILAGWVARQSWADRVAGTYRDQIWTNTDTKIHSVRYIDTDNQRYVTHFIVFFREFGMKTGVFWIDEQCWLDQ